MLNRCLYNMDK